MVLCLPLLLLMMALMINFGTVAGWRVRSLCVSRHAVWSSRWPRNVNRCPRPDYWPTPAAIDAGGAGRLPELDDPRVNLPVARGPLPAGNTVNSDLLDPTRGLRQGSSQLERGFPMIGAMGQYHLRSRSLLLDDKWQYPQMGLWSNRQRRIPVIYALAKADPQFLEAYARAAQAVLATTNSADLAPLDRDDEFIAYHLRMGQGAWAPDFHPRLHQFCTLDRQVAQGAVDQLLYQIQGKQGDANDRIPGLAERMAGAFIGLYQEVIRHLQSQAGANPAVQAEIAQLQAKIQVLEQFRASLRSHGRP